MVYEEKEFCNEQKIIPKKILKYLCSDGIISFITYIMKFPLTIIVLNKCVELESPSFYYLAQNDVNKELTQGYGYLIIWENEISGFILF